MSVFPSLQEIQNSPSNKGSPLAVGLDLLFEHSKTLTEILEPQLSTVLRMLPPLKSYTEFVDIALSEITKWDAQAQAQFISGHPRIGETKNLSNLSAKEQGGTTVNPTSPEVLERLAHLNACYETTYPGLRYITFVNGRSRADIAKEMERVLRIEHSLSTKEPTLDKLTPMDPTSYEWRAELDRAVCDIGRIAKSRLGALGLP